PGLHDEAAVAAQGAVAFFDLIVDDALAGLIDLVARDVQRDAGFDAHVDLAGAGGEGDGAVLPLLLGHAQVALQLLERDVHRLRVVLVDLGAAVVDDPVGLLGFIFDVEPGAAGGNAEDSQLHGDAIERGAAAFELALAVFADV